MRVDISLDLETLSTEPNAAITAIGACAVGWSEEGQCPNVLSVFYQPVSLASSMATGGHVNPSTILWWMQQGDIARKHLWEAGANTLICALQDFTTWLQGIQDKGDGLPNLWGNGVDFDNVVLKSAYDSVKLAAPWGFRQNSCYRTLKKLYPEIKIVEPEVKHNAVQDATAQGIHLVKLLHATGVYSK